ncbi:hypothetical protein [Micromonospora sp. IBHARD004]|uniref:hypothetical protein n=1 Tax=Micromonospora sp. IBHARD004 TaxID=3457764 RepID=UPI0040586FB6
MRPTKIARVMTALFAMTMTFTLGLAAPASAAYPQTSFYNCGPMGCDYSGTEGRFTWYNRTASIYGWMWNCDIPGGAAVAFEAFAGSTKVDSKQVYGDEIGCQGLIEYNLGIGDTNRPGGINRIKVTVCTDEGWTWCAPPRNYSRPF